MRKRLESLVELKLYDKNFIRAINCRVIPVAAYAMSVCQFTEKELYDLDMLVKDILRRRGMLGRQASDERLYLKRQEGGHSMKSLRQVYNETKVRVATYMVCSTSRWIRIAWKRESNSDCKSLKGEAEQALGEVGVEVEFREEEVWKDSEKMEKEWAGC